MRLSPEMRAKVLELAGDANEPPLSSKISEKEFQAAIVELAKRQGWRCYHTHNSRRSTPGFPDLVLLRGPVQIVAELKVGTNDTTAEQRCWLDAFEAAGVTACVWRPEDWVVIVRELT